MTAGPSPGTAIKARGVSIALGGVEVVDGIDVALAVGRWSAIVVPNGAGKSTLLRVLERVLNFLL